ncbi:MAG: beta strand repeat-containing protein, partial [Acidobacteriota bacterium]
GGTLSSSQMSAANQEYQDILTQIGTIGSTTEYNGIQVFGSDQSTSALGWSQGGGAVSNSASATASALAGSAVVAGGSTAGTNATQSGSFAASPTALTWTAGGSGATSVITTGPITNGSQLSGTFGFTPTHSGGSPNAISVDLGTTITATDLATQASQLQTAMNTQAGAADYTVTVVNGNELQIGLGTHASADNITGFPTITNTGSAAAASSTNTYQLTAANGDSLTGTLSLTALKTTAAGDAGSVVWNGQATSSISGKVGSGNTLSGTLTLTTNSGVTGAGTVTPLAAWGTTGSGTSAQYTASITSGNVLSGGFTVTPTGGGSAQDINLGNYTTANIQANLGTTLGSNYTVTYSSGTLTIALSAAGQAAFTGFSVANDSSSGQYGAASQAPATGTLAATINLNGVTTDNLQSTIQAGLAAQTGVSTNNWAGDFTVAYDSSTGALSIATTAAGTSAGITSITASGLQQATSATTSSVALNSVSLAGTNTANLASVVSQALNGTGNGSPDYTVAYDSTSGKLSIGLTAQAATDNITGISWGTSAITQTAAASGSNQASLTFTQGELLGGSLTINQTIAGQAQSAVTVNLSGATSATGTSTANNGADLISAIQTALGNNAKYYDLAYSTLAGNGTVTMSINATGIAANVDSIGIANGTGNNALSQSQMTVSNITGASAMGGFTLTPTGSSTTPVVVNLAGEATGANLVSALQSALGANYLVAESPVNPNSTSTAINDNLTIGVSAAGVAAGITGFTISNASTNGFEQMSSPTGGVNIYTSDGTTAGSKNYKVTVGNLSQDSVGTSDLGSVLGSQITVTVGGVTGTGGTAAGASTGTSLTGTDLTSQANAEAALQTITNAISAVAYQRGQVGANINTLTAASNIPGAEQTNIVSAQNAITATDYASATSNMSKYEILTQTGISALAQANSTQQMVTKLLQ